MEVRLNLLKEKRKVGHANSLKNRGNAKDNVSPSVLAEGEEKSGACQ